MSKPLRLLYICPVRLDIGGVQATIMQLVRHIPVEQVKMDVVVFTDKIGYYEDEFKKYGNIYRVTLPTASGKFRKGMNIFWDQIRIYRGVRKILREEGTFDAIHASFMFDSAPCIYAAYKEHVPVRVAHARMNAPTHENLVFRIKNSLSRKILNRYATVKLGVTRDSIKYLFGDIEDGHVIRNPIIDKEKFNPANYNPETRDYVRLIQVGNLSKRKNPLFTIDVLNWLNRKKDRGYARLTLLGNDNHAGQKDLAQIHNRIAENNLEEYVDFLPADANVAEAMTNSDIMMIPSLQEGLPNVALEAQTMGLPCFLSDAVSRETNCGSCHFLPLEAGAEYWCDEILKYIQDNGLSKLDIDMSAYDMETVCQEHVMIWRGLRYGRK